MRTIRQWNGLVRSCGASALGSFEDTLHKTLNNLV